MKITGIFHVGIVVRNLDLAVRIYEKEFSCGPFEFEDGEFFADKVVNGVQGAGLPMKTAIWRTPDFELELIEPTGPSIYRDFLAQCGPGVHHVILKSDADYQEITSTAKRISGRDPKLDIRFPDGRPIVAYADIQQEAGLLLETCTAGENA